MYRFSPIWMPLVLAMIGSLIWIAPPVSCDGFNPESLFCAIPIIYFLISLPVLMPAAIIVSYRMQSHQEPVELSFERIEHGNHWILTTLSLVSGKKRSCIVKSVKRADFDTIHFGTGIFATVVARFETSNDMEKLLNSVDPNPLNGSSWDTEAKVFDTQSFLALCLPPIIVLTILQLLRNIPILIDEFLSVLFVPWIVSVFVFLLFQYHHYRHEYSFFVQGKYLLVEAQEPTRIQRSIGSGKWRGKITSIKISKGDRVSFRTRAGCYLVLTTREREAVNWFSNVKSATEQAVSS